MFSVRVEEGRIEFTIRSGSHEDAFQQKGIIEISSQTVNICLEGYGGGEGLDDIAVRLAVEDDGLQRVTLFDGDNDIGTTFTLKPAN